MPPRAHLRRSGNASFVGYGCAVADRPPLTVVVPCRDRSDNLRRCLASLTVSVRPGDEIVVVDSASRDRGVESAARDARVGYLRCDLPGASRARNAGWRAARCETVAFTDDDMQVTETWADALAGALAEPGIGFASGMTAVPAGASAAGEPASVMRVPPPATITRATRGVFGASNNVALPRHVLEAVGGFDERLGPGTWLSAGEDLELFDRVLAAGYDGRFVPDALAFHEQWRTPSQRRRLQWAYGKGMGARVAAMARRDPRAAWRMRDEVLRLKGLRTAAGRLAPGERPDDPGAIEDVSGWVGPVAWRLGALLGLSVGLLRLAPADGRARRAACE